MAFAVYAQDFRKPESNWHRLTRPMPTRQAAEKTDEAKLPGAVVIGGDGIQCLVVYTNPEIVELRTV